MTPNNIRHYRKNFTLVGVFDSRQQTENALLGLGNAGFNPASISVIEKDIAPIRSFRPQIEGEQVRPPIMTNSLLGGLLGALIGGLMAAGFNLIPAIGSILALSTFEAGLAGALIGGFVGLIAGSIHGSQTGETPALDAENKAEFARVTIKVSNERALEEARAILEANGAYGTRFYRLAIKPFEKLTTS